jgi:pimeloyl-ACP methyl ester carboxylesterase
VPVDYLEELATYWRTGYDWRAHEAELNAFPQYTTTIDGQRIHFLHVRSPEPDALPLLVTHGWPSTFVELARIIGPLTDPRAHDADPATAFHVVAPSAPGFGFSEPPRTTGWSIPRLARMWAALMRRLGYQGYGVQSNDYDPYTPPELAKIDRDRAIGVYLNGGLGVPFGDDVAELTEADQAEYGAIQELMDQGTFIHLAVNSSRPQTFSYGWHDSPVAQLAWLAEKYKDFSVVELPEDAVDRDQMLTSVTLFWLTGTSGSSTWPYYEGTVEGGAGGLALQGRSTVPTGVYSGGIRRIAERDHHIVHWPETVPDASASVSADG